MRKAGGKRLSCYKHPDWPGETTREEGIYFLPSEGSPGKLLTVPTHYGAIWRGIRLEMPEGRGWASPSPLLWHKVLRKVLSSLLSPVEIGEQMKSWEPKRPASSRPPCRKEWEGLCVNSLNLGIRWKIWLRWRPESVRLSTGPGSFLSHGSHMRDLAAEVSEGPALGSTSSWACSRAFALHIPTSLNILHKSIGITSYPPSGQGEPFHEHPFKTANLHPCGICYPLSHLLCSSYSPPDISYVSLIKKNFCFSQQNANSKRLKTLLTLFCFHVFTALPPAPITVPGIWNLFNIWFIDSSVGKEFTCNAGDPGSISGSGRSPGKGIGYPLQYSWASFVAQLVKNPPTMWETWVQSLGWEDPLEKGKATHSSILAWRIPRTVQSMGSQRVRHDWATFTFTFIEWANKLNHDI